MIIATMDRGNRDRGKFLPSLQYHSAMSSGAGETSAGLRESQYFKHYGLSEISIPPEDVKQLLERINNICGKIHVAKVNRSPHPSA